MARKRPWVKLQYEPLDIENYSEKAAETGAKMENVLDHDAHRLWALFKSRSISEAYDWLDLNQKKLSGKTYVIDTDSGDTLRKYAQVRPTLIFNRRPLNSIRHLNTPLNRTNEALADGGYFWCHGRTDQLRMESIYRSHTWVMGRLLYVCHYLWHRVCPKIPFLKSIYFGLTHGRKRCYNRVEILGRLCRAGFEIVDEGFLHGEFFVLGRKVREPIWGDKPNTGPLIKLNRVGKDGAMIGVYKFRTMYAYSEYLQGYVHRHVGLQDGGKFKDDYRVNFWGRILRSAWLDELPMFINFFKGQMKLVGVRPLSRHYFSLYTPEMQELRIKVKPGLIPPFYYEKQTPKTIEEVQESERRYIEAYLKNPRATDRRYLLGSLKNIIFKRKRSK